MLALLPTLCVTWCTSCQVVAGCDHTQRIPFGLLVPAGFLVALAGAKGIGAKVGLADYWELPFGIHKWTLWQRGALKTAFTGRTWEGEQSVLLPRDLWQNPEECYWPTVAQPLK